jgi:hypothetical protein
MASSGPARTEYSPTCHDESTPVAGLGLNCVQTAKLASRCSINTRTRVEARRLAGRTAEIATVRSCEVKSRSTVPSRSSAAKSQAGAWAIPKCSSTPTRNCSRSPVRKTPEGVIRCAELNSHGCTVPALDERNSGQRTKFVDRLGQAVTRDELRSGNQDGECLREAASDQTGIRQIA